MKIPSQLAGYSLLEVLIALAVTLALGGMATRAFESTTQLSAATLADGRVQEVTSQISLRLASELRWADPSSVILSNFNGSGRVDFPVATGFDGTATVWSAPIAFYYEAVAEDLDGDGVANEGVLLREQGGQQRVLCRNVRAGSLSFARDQERLTIGLTVFARGSEGQLAERQAEFEVTFVNRWIP
jgi:hypothetical protein